MGVTERVDRVEENDCPTCLIGWLCGVSVALEEFEFVIAEYYNGGVQRHVDSSMRSARDK